MAAKEKTIVLSLLIMTLAMPMSSSSESSESSLPVEQEEIPDLEAVASNPQPAAYTMSPAEELLRAAKRAGYNLTLERLDEAAVATDEEVGEMMPAPVAEAFIGHRRRDNIDLIREQMIGMIFTGKPQVLGPRPNRPPPPQMHPPVRRMRPNRPPPPHPGRPNIPFNPQGEGSIQHTRKVPAPDNILKPLPFVPGPTMVKFPSHPKPPSHSKPPSRQANVPRPRPRPPSAPESFRPVKENFGNAVGPDFGPVTFSEVHSNSRPGHFGHDFGSNFPQSKPPTRRPHRPPPQVRPPQGGRPSGGFGGQDGECIKYTEDICLDTFEYPHEAILSSLIRDPSRSDTMIAEVRSQSADNLVDGVSSTQESKYDYQHYFGNRRQGTDNHAHRDFAKDGGYLCPSEVKYARPKRARNSKGKWKYIVNMDKYTQTIRMEKCMKPGGVCSYVSHHYRANCNQVYNYHRLLSWEDGRGLHMDIFKVPSCCSCHIQGYAYVFPPLNRRQYTAGSDSVSHTVRAPPSNTNALAPGSNSEDTSGQAYSPVNYPNVPTKPIRRRRPGSSRPGLRRPGTGSSIDEEKSSTQGTKRWDDPAEFEIRKENPTRGSTINTPKRTGPVSQQTPANPHGIDDDRVNYGYHPIIDFFNPYSFESQTQR